MAVLVRTRHSLLKQLLLKIRIKEITHRKLELIDLHARDKSKEKGRQQQFSI
jgi:hypothetical protein